MNVLVGGDFCNKSEFHYALKLLFRGIDNKTADDSWLMAHKKNLTTKDGAEILELFYNIPEHAFKKLKISSEFLFFSKKSINEATKEYWPSQRTGSIYHAYKFSTIRSNDPLLNMPITDEIRNLFGKDIRIGTEKELLTNTIWKL